MKRFIAISLAIFIALTFTACGSSNYSEYASGDSASSVASYDAPEYGTGNKNTMVAEEAAPAEDAGASTASGGDVGKVQDSSRKLIKNVELTVEALEFDNMVAGVQDKASKLGGYIENSNVSGNSVYGSGDRYAYITVRIPAEKLDEFVADVEGMGNITNRVENVEDITLTYVDMQAHLKSLQTEYDRLLELLAKADNLDSIIALEQRMTDVRYEIESYQSQLRVYDNQVDYSTVNLTINEVERVTPAAEKGVWERISTEFGENLYNVGKGLEEFFVWFVANIPYLVVWAVVIAVIALIVVLIVKGCRKSSEKHAAKRAEKLRRQYEQHQAQSPAVQQSQPVQQPQPEETEKTVPNDNGQKDKTE